MTTSGKIGQIKMPLHELLDAAFRGCRLVPQQVSAEQLTNARKVLQRFLNALPAIITPLWTRENVLMAVPVGKRNLVLPVGTIDVSNAHLRTYQRYTATLTDNGTNLVYDLGGQGKVTVVGIRTSVTKSASVGIEHSTDGSDWDTAVTASSRSYTMDEMVWFEMDPIIDARYIRITGLLGYEIRTFFPGGEATDRPISRINQDTFVNLPPTRQGPPLQYWMDRQETPQMRLWPIPDSTVRNSAISIWRHRQIEDVGNMMQEIEIPARWEEAVIDALAYRIAFNEPKVDISIVNWLKPKADEAMNAMKNEERDSAPIQIQANLRGYTR